MHDYALPPNATTLMESTRSIGYSIESAIADILDNSIAANASTINIDFRAGIDSYIAIYDDGVGMGGKDNLIAAMRYGCKSPRDVRAENDLGRYGLGLKTASLSQCRKLTVVSFCDGRVDACCWDLDHVMEVKDWALEVLDNEEISALPAYDRFYKQKCGTLVIWQNLDKLRIGDANFDNSLSDKMARVREHLSLVFHRYLSGEQDLAKRKILINNYPVSPRDPFLLGKSQQIMADEHIAIGNASIAVRAYMLPHPQKMTAEQMTSLSGEEGLRKSQGFYVYRNRRLIVWGTWFRIIRQDELSKLARVQVDIPNSLDDLWTLDIRKSTATPPEIVRDSLKNLVPTIVAACKRPWTFRGKKEVAVDKFSVWNKLKTRDGGVLFTIDRNHPLVEHVINAGSKTRVALESLLTQIERCLPLNQIYVDLNNDSDIENDHVPTVEELKDTMDKILSLYPSKELKRAMFDRIRVTSPFCDNSDFLEQYEKEAF